MRSRQQRQERKNIDAKEVNSDHAVKLALLIINLSFLRKTGGNKFNRENKGDGIACIEQTKR